jgi:hypothetical protein
MLAEDDRRELVRRLLASRTFARTRHLKAFLAYVCERALTEGPAAIEESDIAGAIWMRRRFDARAGGLVRGQASLVRKKLQRYFATEGAGEPLVLELALGTYVPVFRQREVRDDDASQAPSAPRRFPLGIAAAAILVLAGVAVGVLLTSIRPTSRDGPRLPGEVERVWRQMFANGHPTDLVLSDSNITLFQDLIGRSISVDDYERGRLNALMDERLERGSEAQHLAGRSLEQRSVPMGDVVLATRVLGLQATLGLPVDVVFARDANVRPLQPRNVILSGPRRANPWIDLYEPRLNFQSRFDEVRKLAFFENQAPQAGEEAEYRVVWNVRGFCHVAYRPTLDGRATALIVSGSDMTSTEAGAEFLTSERGVHELRARLNLGSTQAFPYFEVLLATNLVVGGTSSPPVLICHRRITP